MVRLRELAKVYLCVSVCAYLYSIKGKSSDPIQERFGVLFLLFRMWVEWNGKSTFWRAKSTLANTISPSLSLCGGFAARCCNQRDENKTSNKLQSVCFHILSDCMPPAFLITCKQSRVSNRCVCMYVCASVPFSVRSAWHMWICATNIIHKFSMLFFGSKDFMLSGWRKGKKQRQEEQKL